MAIIPTPITTANAPIAILQVTTSLRAKKSLTPANVHSGNVASKGLTTETGATFKARYEQATPIPEADPAPTKVIIPLRRSWALSRSCDADNNKRTNIAEAKAIDAPGKGCGKSFKPSRMSTLFAP
jgi:hypothetical protein